MIQALINGGKWPCPPSLWVLEVIASWCNDITAVHFQPLRRALSLTVNHSWRFSTKQTETQVTLVWSKMQFFVVVVFFFGWFVWSWAKGSVSAWCYRRCEVGLCSGLSAQWQLRLWKSLKCKAAWLCYVQLHSPVFVDVDTPSVVTNFIFSELKMKTNVQNGPRCGYSGGIMDTEYFCYHRH